MMIYAALVCTLVLYTAEATRCRECISITVTADNPFMEMIMQSMFESISNPNCRSNPNSVTTINCPGKCASIQADMDLSMRPEYGDPTNMQMDMLTRGCMDESDGTSFETDNGCHDVAGVKDELVAAMELGEDTTLNAMTGEYCICDRNNCNTD